MGSQWIRLALGPVLALGLTTTPWAVAQNQTLDESVEDWRQANETVRQFPRGHADVLRWEAAQTRPQSAASEKAADLKLLSPAEAVKAAWATHRELAHPLAQLGEQAASHLAAGHLNMVDPSLQRRIHGLDKVMDIATSARKAWIAAVAAHETVEHLENALSAAEAAAELGRRMVRVGNWSRYQQAPFELAKSSARLELMRAHLKARNAEWTLLKAMGLETIHDSVLVPNRLPDVSHQAMEATELAERLAALQKHLPLAERRKAANLTRQAYLAYTVSLEAHLSFREEVLKQRGIMSEETLYRYNGMLESTWGLLNDASSRSQTVVSAIDAQQTALIAETDLLWVLQGGQPQAFVNLGGGIQGSAKAGH